MLFHPVEQAPRPNEFRGQNAQSEHDGQPAGTRRGNHYDPRNEQSEPEQNLQEALGLLQRLHQHFFISIRPTVVAHFCVPGQTRRNRPSIVVHANFHRGKFLERPSSEREDMAGTETARGMHRVATRHADKASAVG